LLAGSISSAVASLWRNGAHDFTLVPWRPALKRQLGKQVGGVVRETGINWRMGRGRDGPEIY
jgi:hypothetical protein